MKSLYGTKSCGNSRRGNRNGRKGQCSKRCRADLKVLKKRPCKKKMTLAINLTLITFSAPRTGWHSEKCFSSQYCG